MEIPWKKAMFDVEQLSNGWVVDWRDRVLLGFSFVGEKGSGMADGAVGGWPGWSGSTGEEGGLGMGNKTTNWLLGPLEAIKT